MLRAARARERYRALVAQEHARLDRLLSRDPLRLRRLVPRRAPAGPLRHAAQPRASGRRIRGAAAITEDDFSVVEDGLDDVLDVIAVCRRS